MRVALTFDTEPQRPGGDPSTLTRILDALTARGVSATFFVQGSWVRDNPEEARRMVAEGHRLGNHTFDHVLPGAIRPEELVGQIESCESQVKATTGSTTRPLFRCPQNSGALDPSVRRTIHDAGYVQVGWSVDSWDWQERIESSEVAINVLRGVDAHPDGCVVLLHSWPEATAEALPGLLDALTAKGCSFVVVDAEVPSLCGSCGTMTA